MNRPRLKAGRRAKASDGSWPACKSARTRFLGFRFLSFLGFYGFLILGIGSAGFAAVPALDHLLPPAAQPGTTNRIVAIGKFDPWPPRVWVGVDEAGIRFRAMTNKGEFSVELDPNVAEGPHLVRLYNEEGAARPRFLVVDRRPQSTEQEPNDEFAAPQPVGNLPAVINGRLDKSGDVDSFGVTLAAGQTLIASVEAYVLESPLDAVLRVTDARGVQQTWNHDARTFDPFLTFTAREAGPYVVQVMGFPHPATSEIRFHGGDKCVYRLQLSGGPYLAHTLPLGAGRPGPNRFRLIGWNLPDLSRATTTLPADRIQPGSPLVTVSLDSVENTVTVPVGDGPESIEVEPNDKPAEAAALDVPGARTGCIERAGDEDRYRIAAGKGERFQLAVQSAGLGFPVDAWLKIEDTNGVQLAQNDDRRGADPELEWAAPSDGTFIVAVGSLVHRGESNHFYRLTAVHPKPDFKASVAEHSFVAKAGTTNDLKVTVNRLNGFTNRITVRVTGLPEGVSVAPADVSEKGGEVVLKLVTATNAAPYSGVFQVASSSGSMERAASFSLISTSENNGVPGGYRELVIPATDQIWLTVRGAEKKEAK